MTEGKTLAMRKRPLLKDWRIWLVALLILASVLFIIGNSENKRIDGTLDSEAVIEKAIEAPPKYLNVEGTRLKRFISDMEFFGLQSISPDKEFFLHMAAPGFSVQFEGQAPEELTGIMIDLSYDQSVLGKGISTIAALMQIVFPNQDEFRTAQTWFENQLVNSEINARQGNQPEEKKLELNGIVVQFFPPLSAENLEATLLFYSKE